MRSTLRRAWFRAARLVVRCGTGSAVALPNASPSLARGCAVLPGPAFGHRAHTRATQYRPRFTRPGSRLHGSPPTGLSVTVPASAPPSVHRPSPFRPRSRALRRAGKRPAGALSAQPSHPLAGSHRDRPASYRQSLRCRRQADGRQPGCSSSPFRQRSTRTARTPLQAPGSRSVGEGPRSRSRMARLARVARVARVARFSPPSRTCPIRARGLLATRRWPATCGR